MVEILPGESGLRRGDGTRCPDGIPRAGGRGRASPLRVGSAIMRKRARNSPQGNVSFFTERAGDGTRRPDDKEKVIEEL
jgi:hypothetical protein